MGFRWDVIPLHFDYNRIPNRPDQPRLVRPSHRGQVELGGRFINPLKFTQMTEEEIKAVMKAVNAALDAREEKKREILLSREAVAERLHVNVATLWRWAKSNYLSPTRIGRKVWYYESQIERLLHGEKEA